MPPLILYKSDGAVMYGTTDLATLVNRMRDYSPVRIAYVVDQRQGLHFEQVFRAARMTGIVPDTTELVHAGFGTMNGTDGKPFKTRAGGVMKLSDLIGMAVEKGRQRLAEADLAKDFSGEEKEEIARKVGIAAIKFADLQNQRQQDYVFDLDRMTACEGKTGPYILYQIVRIKSLLRKAEAQGDYVQDRPGKIRVSDGDRALALLLTELPEAFELALRNLMPHYLCDYAYRVAQQFSSFYGSCHILSEPDAELRASRLALCALAAAQLGLVLELLGIEAPERM
jgi:arginyl-tRNA synthetase